MHLKSLGSSADWFLLPIAHFQPTHARHRTPLKKD